MHCSKIDTSCNLVKDYINKRLVVYDYPYDYSLSKLVQQWRDLALRNEFQKIWLWAYDEHIINLQGQGFILEGRLGPQKGLPTASMACFLNHKRAESKKHKEEEDIIESIYRTPICYLPSLPRGFCLRYLRLSDAVSVSGLLKKVFKTYPSPIEPDNIKKLMYSKCLFAGAFYENTLVSLSAAYPDDKYLRCEMTDCATLKAYRGYSLTQRLLILLEDKIADGKNYILYTLARAGSYGINRTFYKNGYSYKGRLINNCHIAGSWEDMNLWVKE